MTIFCYFKCVSIDLEGVLLKISFFYTANLPIQLVSWINNWLGVNVLIRSCNFSEAIKKLEELRQTEFGNNELINLMLGQCYYYNGDHDTALIHLHRGHINNFYLLDGLCNY